MKKVIYLQLLIAKKNETIESLARKLENALQFISELQSKIKKLEQQNEELEDKYL
jgi:prefoldin subunit 5